MRKSKHSIHSSSSLRSGKKEKKKMLKKKTTGSTRIKEGKSSCKLKMNKNIILNSK